MPTVEMSERRAVEEACKPFWNQSAVEVELAVAPKFVVGVNGNAKLLPPPAPQSEPVPVITPLVWTCKHCVEPVMLVVIAPVFETENRVVVASAVEEPIAKSVL